MNFVLIVTMKIKGRIASHLLGIKEFLKEDLECRRVGENRGLTNGGFRYFMMKNIVNKGRFL